MKRLDVSKHVVDMILMKTQRFSRRNNHRFTSSWNTQLVTMHTLLYQMLIGNCHYYR